jgi:PAS domain S-box-containing protein
MNILVVDDHATNRKLLRAQLEAERFVVVEAANGVEGLTVLKRESIDAIISDILMPRMDGFRFCYEVRTNEYLRHLPFICYTATYTAPSDEKLSLELGADKFIKKPAAPAVLIEALHEVMKGTRHPPKLIEPPQELNLMKEYTERLVKKLEEKNVELEEQNEALSRAQERLHLQATAMESAANGIIVTDASGTILSANPAFAKLTGYTAEDIIGKTPRILKSGKHEPAFYKNLWKTILSGQTWRGEFVNRRKDGSIFYDEHTITPVRSDSGKITHFIGIMHDVTERRRAEDELRASHQLIEGIINAIPVRVFWKDKNLVYLGCNAVFARDAGFADPKDIVGKDDDQMGWHDRAELYRGDDREVIESGCPKLLIEEPLTTPDGNTLTILTSKIPLRNSDGEITGVLGTFIDITERKEGEEMLRASERRYRSLFESNPNPMWVYDVETLSFLAVNAAAVRHYGYSQDEFLAMTIKDIRPTEDIPGLIDDMSRRDDDLNPKHWRHFRKDRTMIDVEITSHDLIWGGKRAELVLINDVTERKKADERLREQADMLNRAQDAIMALNFDDHRITFWNDGAERLYGWTAEEAIGQPIIELIYTEAKERTELLRTLTAAGEFRGQLKQITKDRREIIVDGRSTIVSNLDGTPRSVLSINTDVTEQKNLEMQLLRAQRLESIGTLAGGVAHDLNNILTPILMCSEMLRDEETSRDPAPLVALIEDSARRGAAIVKQVLTFARGVEGERVAINPRHLLEEIIDIARKTFPKAIEIRGHYPKDLGSIEGDPTQLHQVLLNLSVNARDAMMPGGGQIVVRAENLVVDENYAAMTPGAKPGPHVVIQVSDTGTGMTRATIDKIFDPFFTTKEVAKGTGLGLSTALGIVQSHGGFISVYSEVGKGTTFKVYLPVTMNQDAMQKSETSKAHIQGNNENILVVDDEASILNVTTRILENNKYRVISAGNGPEALALFAPQMGSINLVLTDMSMPYMDGVALVRALKKMRPELSIIASTGQSEEFGMAELRSLGVKNFLSKPYNTEKLLTAVDDAVNGRESKSSEPADRFSHS